MRVAKKENSLFYVNKSNTRTRATNNFSRKINISCWFYLTLILRWTMQHWCTYCSLIEYVLVPLTSLKDISMHHKDTRITLRQFHFLLQFFLWTNFCYNFKPITISDSKFEDKFEGDPQLWLLRMKLSQTVQNSNFWLVPQLLVMKTFQV